MHDHRLETRTRPGNLLEPAVGSSVPIALDALTVAGDQIVAVNRIQRPERFSRLGLPDRLAS